MRRRANGCFRKRLPSSSADYTFAALSPKAFRVRFCRISQRSVIPAEAGIQESGEKSGLEDWMPACAGMAEQRIRLSPLCGNLAKLRPPRKTHPCEGSTFLPFSSQPLCFTHALYTVRSIRGTGMATQRGWIQQLREFVTGDASTTAPASSAPSPPATQHAVADGRNNVIIQIQGDDNIASRKPICSRPTAWRFPCLAARRRWRSCRVG
jgi:hypothetical protein